MKPAAWLPLLAPVALTSCAMLEGTEIVRVDPVVVVHGTEGDELAVSTNYGIVFLGRTAQSGRVGFTAWFGDGPSQEEGLVESMGGGLFATEGEILLPCVAVCFEPPPAGTRVTVRGRRAGKPFEIEAKLAADPRVSGVLLAPSEELDQLTDAELGSGVFYIVPGKPLQLLGLVTGRLTLDGGRPFVTVLGPDDLWRLVVHRRNSDRPRRFLYREDIL